MPVPDWHEVQLDEPQLQLHPAYNLPVGTSNLATDHDGSVVDNESKIMTDIVDSIMNSVGQF